MGYNINNDSGPSFAKATMGEQARMTKKIL